VTTVSRRAPAADEPDAAAAPRLLRGRLLLLDDHENLCGGPDAPAAVARAVWEALTDALRVNDEDNVVVGLSDFGVKNFMDSLPVNSFQLVSGKGQDAADRALIEAVDPDHVADRFDSVAIASGDHIFADLARRLRRRGLLVCNVTAGPAGASHALARACHCRARLKLDVRDRGRLSRAAASRAGAHGYEGRWIVRHLG
jgi:hypothetical protein